MAITNESRIARRDVVVMAGYVSATWNPCKRENSVALFAYRNTLRRMAKENTGKGRKEAMGGLGKGLAVIRAFKRDHASLSSDPLRPSTPQEPPNGKLNRPAFRRR